jgi:general L-amino acid transport system permease protein
VLRVVLQVVFLAAVLGVIGYLLDNLGANLRRQGIRTGWEFLDQPAGFQISGSGFRSSQRVRDAIGVGIRNTAALAVAGIVLTTILGVVIGVARLSSNWLVRKSAAFYVETLRNIPPLLIIIFAFTAVILRLPRIQEATDLGGLVVLSNRDLAVASPRTYDNAGAYWVVLLVAAALAVGLGAWRTRRFNETGRPHHRVLWGGGALLAVAVIGWVALGGPLGLSRPEAVGLGVQGGAGMKAAYAAMLIALVLYTASHVAEIVRGSIQAVERGQVEAASALALSDFQRLRFIVLPQAFRIAVPPIINQYLNLTKNTSLGVAIGYPEITALSLIIIGNGNPAPQTIAIGMGIYLTFSLVISALSNVVNRRLQLVER